MGGAGASSRGGWVGQGGVKQQAQVDKQLRGPSKGEVGSCNSSRCKTGKRRSENERSMSEPGLAEGGLDFLRFHFIQALNPLCQELGQSG